MKRPFRFLAPLGLAVVLGCSSGGGGSSGRGATVALPGNTFYPDGLSADLTGNLYVGSLGQGEIVRIDPAGNTTVLAAASNVYMSATAGVYFDNPTSRIYACGLDLTGAKNATVQVFDATGSRISQFTFGMPVACNDFAPNGRNGDLYLSDTKGRIWRLASGTSQFALWTSDGQLAPSSPSGYGASGIVFDGLGTVYVDTFSDGKLVAIPVNANGSAGTAVTIPVTPGLSQPGALRLETVGVFLLAQGSGSLVRLLVSGSGVGATASTVSLETGLNDPTSIARAPDGVWVSEGQLPALFGAGSPTLPFDLKRFPSSL